MVHRLKVLCIITAITIAGCHAGDQAADKDSATRIKGSLVCPFAIKADEEIVYSKKEVYVLAICPANLYCPRTIWHTVRQSSTKRKETFKAFWPRDFVKDITQDQFNELIQAPGAGYSKDKYAACLLDGGAVRTWSKQENGQDTFKAYRFPSKDNTYANRITAKEGEATFAVVKAAYLKQAGLTTTSTAKDEETKRS